MDKYECFFYKPPTDTPKGFKMKSWHWGIIIVAIVAYFIGAMYPAAANVVKSKIGA